MGSSPITHPNEKPAKWRAFCFVGVGASIGKRRQKEGFGRSQQPPEQPPEDFSSPGLVVTVRARGGRLLGRFLRPGAEVDLSWPRRRPARTRWADRRGRVVRQLRRSVPGRHRSSFRPQGLQDAGQQVAMNQASTWTSRRPVWGSRAARNSRSPAGPRWTDGAPGGCSGGCWGRS